MVLKKSDLNKSKSLDIYTISTNKPPVFGIILEDTVNSPQHYQGAGMEVIDVLKAFLTPEEFKGYLKGNILKYQLRFEKKGGVNDLRKSQWYQNKVVEILNGSHSTKQ